MAKRPASGPIVSVAVRRDGFVLVAIQPEPMTDNPSGRAFRAEIYVKKSPGAWVKGPDSHSAAPFTCLGDPSPSARTGSDDGRHPRPRREGPVDPDRPSSRVAARGGVGEMVGGAREARGAAGLPKPSASGGVLVLPGPVTLKETIERCRGVSCLKRRSAIGSPPRASVIQEGKCAKEDALTATKRAALGDKHQLLFECDPDAPAQRAATLAVQGGDEPVLARLPLSCAEGDVVGTDRASFVACSAKHRGRPAILYVSPAGAITEVTSVPGELHGVGVESASDGTTAILAREAAWICQTVDAPSCAALAHDGLLAARPQPGGRALVARRGASDRELVLELFGAPAGTVSPVKIAVAENVLDFEITAEGQVRLWTSPSLTSMASLESLAWRREEMALNAYLVRADGQLVADDAAVEALKSGRGGDPDRALR